MQNDNSLALNWKQHRDLLRQQWHSLNDRDIDTIAGDRNVLVSILQEKYGFTELTARAEVEHYLQDVRANQLQAG
jgi:hypothetical protein